MNVITRMAAAVALMMTMVLGVALAGNMEARYGNTVVSTYPDGTVVKFFYNKDGTLSVKGTMGGKTTEATGKWRPDGANICITLSANMGIFEANKERCVPLNGDKVGDKWQVPTKDASGKDIKVDVTIVAGR